MVYLAEALASFGLSVSYIYIDEISQTRANMGWESPSTTSLKLLKASDRTSVIDIVDSSPATAIHICQGIRANKLVSVAQAELSKRHISYWAIIETIDERFISGFLKRLLYSVLIKKKSVSLRGILSIGWTTKSWLAKRGFCSENIFPFAYFLSDSISLSVNTPIKAENKYQFIFVGQLIGRKCIHLLIKALSLCPTQDYVLTVIGVGSHRPYLEKLASEVIPGKINWLGNINMKSIPGHISSSDCLILPSRHDGWGAVVSEALMVGTPVICSDSCGSADVVRASGFGGVFPASNVKELTILLNSMILKGPINILARERLSRWSSFLGARQGAKYLMSILFPHLPKIPFPPSTINPN